MDKIKQNHKVDPSARNHRIRLTIPNFRIHRAIHNLSIKKSFMLYMLLFLLVAAFLSSLSINFASNIKNNINLSYADKDNTYTLRNEDTTEYTDRNPDASYDGKIVVVSPATDYSQDDKAEIAICTFVEIWSIPIFFGLCIILSALLFYRDKLQKPIALLHDASEKIAINDLAFSLTYDSRDEMGQLCASFEAMRAALEENNRNMWRDMEERKRLNAAFSHDLRTPLTVLRGYTDFLKKYLPEDKISEEKLLSTVSTMSDHITRLENYARTMSEAQKLEDIAVCFQTIESSYLVTQLQGIADVAASQSSPQLAIQVENKITQFTFVMDFSLVIRVYENILANALRFAIKQISVEFRYSNHMLTITVADDGNGFAREDMKQAGMPHFRRNDSYKSSNSNNNNDSNNNNNSTNEVHFGLGLYICRILCEKHKGRIVIENGTNEGAKVTASFLCDIDLMR